LSRDTIGDISDGRLWVSASVLQSVSELDENVQDALDDIKGAYQRVGRTDVWEQPVPEVDEPGVQHRLLKDPNGFWKIEEKRTVEGEVNTESWVTCAKEIPGGLWVDLRNDRKVIQVKTVAMATVLERMMNWVTTLESVDVQKYVEFLFKTCNQKKLNSKLKRRNLKHNISNLRVKLEKQYALSFAVKVANMADVIAHENAEAEVTQIN